MSSDRQGLSQVSNLHREISVESFVVTYQCQMMSDGQLAIPPANGRFRRALRVIWRVLRKPTTVLSLFGLVGFVIDMCIKPISNSALILLLVAAFPWLLRIVKRLKVGEFLEIETASAEEAQAKLQKEAEEANEVEGDQVLPDATTVPVIPAAPADASGIPPPASTTVTPNLPRSEFNAPESSISASVGATKTTISQVYSVESLVLDYLQRLMEVPFQRYVRLGAQTLDAVALTEPPTIIEVKYISVKANYFRRIREVIAQLHMYSHEWRRRKSVRANVILVLASELLEKSTEFRNLCSSANNAQIASGGSIEIMTLSLPSVRQEFGLDETPG